MVEILYGVISFLLLGKGHGRAGPRCPEVIRKASFNSQMSQQTVLLDSA